MEIFGMKEPALRIGVKVKEPKKKKPLIRLDRKPKPRPSIEDIDYTWPGVRASWTDAWRKTYLFIRYLPEELLDAAEDAIQNWVERTKESATSRMTRFRDRIKSAIARRKIRRLEFWKKVLFFSFIRRRLDQRIRIIEKSMIGNYIEELRRDIGDRLTGLEPIPTEDTEKAHAPSV